MRRTTAVLIVGSFPLAAMPGCAPERVPAEAPPPPAQPSSSPADYAAATFESWVEGDQAGVKERALPAVATMLAARAAEHADGWEAPRCEGAAGSAYCTWVRPEIQLTIQVANKAAPRGLPRAVTGAAFEAAPGAVAIWPYTTEEQARNSPTKATPPGSSTRGRGLQLRRRGARLAHRDSRAGPSCPVPIPGDRQADPWRGRRHGAARSARPPQRWRHLGRHPRRRGRPLTAHSPAFTGTGRQANRGALACRVGPAIRTNATYS